MSLLVTGTIGIDTIETPHGRADTVLGGSAAHFAFAAALVHPVRLVGVVGDDFPAEFRACFADRPIDAAGLEVRAGSKTFSWHGRYHENMNNRDTLRTDLNVIAEAPPIIPDRFRDSQFVFLANTHPSIQRGFLEQLTGPSLVVCDTMDLWINSAREELLKTLTLVHGIVLNDGEARMLTDHDDLYRAARAVLDLGPAFVVVKRGEYGSMLMMHEDLVVLPAYPTQAVKDPTGAGDSFAGGMMACLAAENRLDIPALKRALACGACVASITIEDFSLDAIRRADPDELNRRIDRYRDMLRI
jgi:sugar/nucleoside kinase (ribokinase family)